MGGWEEGLKIGRVRTTVGSKSYGFSLPKLGKLSSESEELQKISLDDRLRYVLEIN